MINGKTAPSLIVCEEPGGRPDIEIVTKYSSGCERREQSLACEVISACLAADLGLPIMEPFLVDLDQDFVAAVPDEGHRQRMESSNPVAFGSKLITGFSSWSIGSLISDALLPGAAAVLAFDAIVQNPDRRDGNSNCLVSGDSIRIFDHELAFAHKVILLWQPPWRMGSLGYLETPGRHIFRSGLLGKNIDFQPIRRAWAGLSDEMIDGYGQAIPAEWQNAAEVVADAIQLIKDARDNIDACIVEINRVLQ